MEQKYSATVEQVYALLTNGKWLEERCLTLGELSASCKVKKAAGGVVVTMKRRVRRELPGIIAKVISPESDLEFEENWGADEEGTRSGSMVMTAAGQPIKMTADFELAPSGKGCIYRIKHKVKASVPLIGGTIERFALGQVEQGCADEFAYLVSYLKKNKAK